MFSLLEVMFIKLSIDCQLFDVLRYLLDRRPGGKWPGFLRCFLFHKDSRGDHMTSLLLRVLQVKLVNKKTSQYPVVASEGLGWDAL